MKTNLFAQPEVQETRETGRSAGAPALTVPDYTVSRCTVWDHILAFLVGFAAGFLVLFIFYKIILLSILGGAVTGVVNIFAAEQRTLQKRIRHLRTQFFDLLEAMSVAMRAGNPVLKALESARDDLLLIHGEGSDIITELDIILSRFHNAIPLSQSFADLARRSGLEDIQSFASVYATIEGKSSRADEIIRETQTVIADKTSDNAADRVFRVRFNLKAGTYDKKKVYRLVIANEIDVEEIEFHIDIAFADDFGFDL